MTATQTTFHRLDWCDRCGRRRGTDGRCVECDGWWTHPLICYGGPIVGGVTMLLITFLLMPWSPRSSKGAILSRENAIVAPLPRSATAPLANPRFASAAVTPPHVPALPPPPPPPIPAPEALQAAELARLRLMTDYAAAAAGQVEAVADVRPVAPTAIYRVPAAVPIAVPINEPMGGDGSGGAGR